MSLSQQSRTNHRTRIKVCGLTRPQDVTDAMQWGADALGFVFYQPSKRCLTPAQYAGLVRHIPAFVSTVALFVEPDVDLVNRVCEASKPTLLQFHGAETPEFCRQFNMPYIKAVRVGAPSLDTPQGLLEYCLQFDDAAAWLFDSFTPAYGGSGHRFDRNLIVPISQDSGARPIVMSGGLTCDTVAETIHLLKPWAVDISSGVEISAGIKSADKLQAFISAVAQADAAHISDVSH